MSFSETMKELLPQLTIIDGKYYSRNLHFTQMFEHYPALDRFYFDWEKSFDADVLQSWMCNHWEIPIGAVILYCLMLVFVPPIFKTTDKSKQLNLKYPLAAWNAFLCIFSFCGMVRTVPHLLHHIATNSFRDSVCMPPVKSWGAGATGFWVQLFVLSKLPELVDSVFYVLKGRLPMFLHWYHHITVLLYCWHAYTHESGAGLYFVGMNYSVHAIMYGYYCLQTLNMVPKSFPAYLITFAQIAQMIVGTFVCASSIKFFREPEPCSATMENLIAGGTMYFSYLYLFCDFAYRRFVLGQKDEPRKKKD